MGVEKGPETSDFESPCPDLKVVFFGAIFALSSLGSACTMKKASEVRTALMMWARPERQGSNSRLLFQEIPAVQHSLILSVIESHLNRDLLRCSKSADPFASSV